MHKYLIILLTLFSFTSDATDLSALSRSERQDFYGNKLVLKSFEIENEAWPKLEIYGLIDGQALEFAAFFCDFESQKKYTPDLLSAVILPHDNPLLIPVKYEMNLPFPLSNAQYTHAHQLAKNSDGSYSVSWSVITSTVAEKVIGKSTFIPSGDKTLWFYESLVTPKSSLAGLFSSSMKSDTLKSLQSTKAAFLRLKKDNPEQLKTLVSEFSKKFLDSTK
tara:strand:+ start:4851 stop:5510 length:660 start_codon:yes stop_codon:yes gene_type:complete